ncbi:lactate utilization protein [Desulfolutivibrio sulfoxidireducens]|uniref:lactate utilization protein n=1 Tax=Desulfolutivibrio sulfoxidireducens TaxID=2773299 RepID=UPI00159DE1BE|nr:lactate utilization protein [Desulfolutivibrio sulfoxidireducens]QLA17263.1 lactate utilization protein [Desulfolutivibrio sulfoxidireducens]
MDAPADLVELFRTKAEMVSAVTLRAADMPTALAYVVDACEKKDACKLLLSGCEAALSAPAAELCETVTTKTIAAPDLSDADFAALGTLCEHKGFRLIRDGLRNHLGGIDIAVTHVDAGIAETGTLVLRSQSEELRLATMVAEVHIALLPVSVIKATSHDVEPLVRQWMADPPDYTAFITGASRTADIERVLALGVHGPLELHIVFLTEA